MRPAPIKKVEPFRVAGIPAPKWVSRIDGRFMVPLQCSRRVRRRSDFLLVIATDGLGWDHVSVSHPHRCPTWEEMEKVRELFFDDSETVLQFSVPRELHINNHPRCLHLWRNQAVEVELPPEWMI